MKKTLVILAMLGLVLALCLPAQAGQREDSEALVKAALAMAKDKGLDATLAAVKDPKGPFVKGPLYIFAGKVSEPGLVAHPIKPALVGKNLAKMKDVKGKFFFVEFMNIAKNPGQGWVEYWWPKPGEKKASPKDTYVARVPGQAIWFACGYYK